MLLWLVVSLPTSIDRRQSIINSLAKWNIEPTFVDAFDGRAMSLEERRWQFGAWHDREGRYLSGGEIGCYISHYIAMQCFLQSNEDICVITEDDIELLRDPLPLLDTLKKAQGVVDILKLISTPMRRNKAPMLFNNPVLPFGHIPGGTYGTQGYAITRQGAGKALAKRKSVIDLPLDDHLFVYRSGDLSIVECIPPIVRSLDVETTIPGRQVTTKKRSSISQKIMKIYYQIERLKSRYRSIKIVSNIEKIFPTLSVS